MKKLINVFLLIILVLMLSLPIYSEKNERIGLTEKDIEEFAMAQKDAFKYQLLYEKEKEKYILGILHEQAFWLLLGMGVGVSVR